MFAFGRRLILFGGVVVPTLLLAVLAVVSLRLMADLRTATRDTAIRVTGEQFWWRVEYLTPDGDVAVETANEIHLPLGEPVAARPRAPDCPAGGSGATRASLRGLPQRPAIPRSTVNARSTCAGNSSCSATARGARPGSPRS